jgi:hypothetical protein
MSGLRQQIRASLNPKDAREEFFKLALEFELSVDVALAIRQQMLTLRP